MSTKLIPYLVTNGNGKEAIQFYEKALEGQLLFSQTFGEMPENPEFPLPPEAKQLIAHASIRIGESELMLSDSFPGQPHLSGNHVTICITEKDSSKSRQYFEALQEGGQVIMPLTETHFSPAYGMVTDKFGVVFHVYTESERK